MNEMQIINPCLIAFYFYKRDVTNEKLLDNLISKLTLENDEENYKVFKNIFKDVEYRLEWLTYYDSIVLRFSLCKTGVFSSEIWLEQKESLIQISQNLKISEENFLGSSILYWGIVNSLDDDKYGKTLQTITTFGNVWQHSIRLDERKVEYIFITPKDKEEKTKKHFLFATDHGLLKIESHFHKANTDIREYEEIRGKLMGNIKTLDEELETLLETIRGKKQKEKLYNLTPKYTYFVQNIASVNKLKNTLQINIDNYKERLEILRREKDRIYDPHIKRFERALVQIDHDLEYCKSTISSVGTSLDMLRGMNSVETQNRGVTIQSAMALVEVVLVFYYSLGAWHYLIEEEWNDIPLSIKLAVGILLAVFVPLKVHSFVEKKWIKFGTFLGFVLVGIFLACYFTFKACNSH